MGRARSPRRGLGGVTAVALATGLSDRTVRDGIKELDQSSQSLLGRQRRPGGGRKSREVEQPGLLAALETLVEPGTRGDPRSPLRWCSRSTRSLAAALTKKGYTVSHTKVGELLKAQGFSLQFPASTFASCICKSSHFSSFSPRSTCKCYFSPRLNPRSHLAPAPRLGTYTIFRQFWFRPYFPEVFKLPGFSQGLIIRAIRDANVDWAAGPKPRFRPPRDREYIF